MTGWYPRRRGILEHLDRGTVSLLDIAVHDVLSLWADHKNGVCLASAEKIHALCPADISYKSIQRSLAKLEELGWIKRWLVRGKRGNYPVLVCRYFVHDASMTWWSTNGLKTVDWRNVQLDPVYDPSFSRPGPVREVAHEVSGVQEVIIKNEEPNKEQKQKQTLDAKPASPAPAAAPEIIESFKILKSKPFGSEPFQQIWTQCAAENGDPTTWIDAMENCIQRCNESKVKVPPFFFRIKRGVENMEVADKFRPETAAERRKRKTREVLDAWERRYFQQDDDTDDDTDDGVSEKEKT